MSDFNIRRRTGTDNARALKSNLGKILNEQRARLAQGERWQALSGLLPNITARIAETEQQTNLAAFGFSGFPGVPQIIGPFGIFDSRVYLSQPVIDLTAISHAKAGSVVIRGTWSVRRLCTSSRKCSRRGWLGSR